MKMITIMPDYGMSPYGWIKDDGDEESGVGGCFADALSGFQGYMVSAELEADFAAWARWFGREADGDTMDWERFHREGLALAKRLKAEIGDQARVVYDKPVEDPSFDRDAPTEVSLEVLADGSLRPFAPYRRTRRNRT